MTIDERPEKPDPMTEDRYNLILQGMGRLRIEMDRHDTRSEERHREMTAHLCRIEAVIAAQSVRADDLKEEADRCEGWRNEHEQHHRMLEGRALAWALGIIGTLVASILALFASGKLP